MGLFNFYLFMQWNLLKLSTVLYVKTTILYCIVPPVQVSNLPFFFIYKHNNIMVRSSFSSVSNLLVSILQFSLINEKHIKFKFK